MPRRCSQICSIEVSPRSLQTTAASKMWLQAIASLSLLAVPSHALTTTAAQRPVQALQRFLDDVTTTSAARVATEDGQLHLQLTKNIRRGDCVLEVPLDACVTIDRARAMPWLQAAEANARRGVGSLVRRCVVVGRVFAPG